VVILSADATQHHMSQLTAAGANASLTKPISVRALLHTIDQELGEPHPTGPAPAIPSHTTTLQKHT
jgi:CheY-like chemotaxis protein